MRSFLDTAKVYNDTKAQLKHCQIHIQELRELAGFPPSSGQEFSINSSNPSSVVERIVMKILQLEKEQQDIEYLLEGLREDVCKCMDRNLDTKSKEIVELRIFGNRSWGKIARKTRYSYSRVRQIYKEAIEKLQSSKMYEFTPMEGMEWQQ